MRELGGSLDSPATSGGQQRSALGCSDGVVNSSCDRRKSKPSEDASVAQDAPVSNDLEVWSQNIGILSPAYFSGLETDDSSSDWGTFGSLSTPSLK